MLSQVVQVVVSKEDNWDNYDNTNREARSVLRLGCENSAKISLEKLTFRL